MISNVLRFLAATVLLLPAVAPGQTPFTYQGKLENNGTPFTGTVHLRLGLYTAVSGLSPLKQEVMANVSVADGIFTVMPTTFTAAEFPGAARWIQIEVSNNGGTTYTPLTPRQQVTHTPYAIRASLADSATTVSGSVPASQLSGFINPVSMGAGTINQTLNFSPASGSPFTVGGSTKVTNLNSDLIDGLDSAAFLQKSGGTMTGNLGLQNPATLGFGSTTRQMLNLFNADYGIGVQTNTLYQRSNGRFAWYTGGSHSDTEGSQGSGGTYVATLTSGGMHLRPNVTNTGAMLAIGDNSSTTGLPFVHLREPPGQDDTLELSALKVRITSQNQGVPPSITFGQTTGQHLVLYEGAGDTYGIGVQGSTEYFRTGEAFAWYKDGDHSDTPGSAGGGASVMTLSGGGELDVKGPFCGYAMANRDNPAKRWELYSRNYGTLDELAVYSSSAGGDILSLNPSGDMYIGGTLSTTVLTIRGGADVAEPFEMTQPEEMEEGSVVVIDDKNPGKLKLSTEACDTRVAGIISGAGGVKPGLRLHQEGVMEGDHHVALSGRVYVKADAGNGAIRPGDLLTTSDKPGHAMKVTKHSEAQGAILGKAMSALDEGNGLVLVLVTLQ